MSLYATVDDKPAGDVATSSGWTDFAAWIATLDGVTELRHLIEYGWADDAETLAADLRGAIEDGEPTPDQQSIAAGLLKISESAGVEAVITVSDGVGVVESAAHPITDSINAASQQ